MNKFRNTWTIDDLTKWLLKSLNKDIHLHNAAALIGSLGMSSNCYDKYVSLCKEIKMMEVEMNESKEARKARS